MHLAGATAEAKSLNYGNRLKIFLAAHVLCKDKKKSHRVMSARIKARHCFEMMTQGEDSPLCGRAFSQ